MLTIVIAHVTEMDRSEIIIIMEVRLESEHSETDDVEPGSPKG